MVSQRPIHVKSDFDGIQTAEGHIDQLNYPPDLHTGSSCERITAVPTESSTEEIHGLTPEQETVERNDSQGIRR